MLAQSQLTIKPLPEKIYIEAGRNLQIVNFDFLVANSGSDTLELQKIEVSVFDKAGKLLHSRFLDNNGTAPSIKMLPIRKWSGNESQLIFNPFSEFALATEIAKMQFEWTFEDGAEKETILNTTLSPIKYTQQQKFKLPVKGRIMVYDAHDYASHHRRFDYNFGPIKSLGLTSNFMRYAYDFIIVDKHGKQYSQSGKSNDHHHIFGKDVYAAAPGKVIYVASTHADDGTFNVPKLKDNALELYGNCIAIEHSPGVISIYGHLKKNSVKVKLGDAVKSGQPIASVGSSGSSFFPHLHFEVRTSIDHQAQGLPSYFENLQVVEGEKRIPVKGYAPETGSIIESK